MLTNGKVEIIATGSYVPEYVLSNDEIAGRIAERGITGKTLERLFGLRERREARDESCSDLIAKAARNVLENSGFTAKELDRILVSSTPGDYFEPPDASIVQYKIGAKCPAYDPGMSCVGWLAGFEAAVNYLSNPNSHVDLVLVMAGTRIGRICDGNKPEYRAIFGDGAAGVLIGKSDEEKVKALKLWTDGKHHKLITLYHEESIDKPGSSSTYFNMDEKSKIYDVLENNLHELEEVFEKNSRKSIKHAFIHKPSGQIFNFVLEKIKIPREKTYQNYDKYGNTISAELPLALDECVREGKIKRGDRVFFFSYGAGVNGGAMVMEY